jgi:riboflavin synthase
MFTGLIEHLGRVAAVDAMEGGFRLRLDSDMAADLREGDSIAVNGVCLTVVQRDAVGFTAEIGPETARVTSLGACRAGTLVNLERPMRPDGRMGGHFVLGHVDGMGTLVAARDDGEFWWITVRFDAALAPYFIPKGSVAVDGISLTVAALRASEFDVQIIPFTWDHTNLKSMRPGDAVNLEVDVIGKYVLRVAQLAGMWPAGAAAPLETP